MGFNLEEYPYKADGDIALFAFMEYGFHSITKFENYPLSWKYHKKNKQHPQEALPSRISRIFHDVATY